MKVQSESMRSGPLLPNIIRYAVPVMLTTLIQLLFNAADLAIVGQFCGSVSVAAVGNTGSLTSLFVNCFMGLSVGAGVMVAQGLGRQDSTAVHRTVHTALPAALISGLALTVLGVVLCEPFLRLMNTPENVLPLSALYMRIYFCGITFNLVYNFCAAILRAVGDTKSPLLFLTLSGLVNVVLNVVFVTVVRLDVAGVALATTISQALAAVLVVWALLRRRDECRLELGKIRIYSKQLRQMIRIGLPAGLQSSMFSISNMTIQSAINSFGDVFMSGNSAATSIEGFLGATVTCFHQAALNFIGQNVGAGQYKRVRQTLWLCMLCALTTGTVFGFLAYTFGPQLLHIYISDSPEAIAYGMVRIATNFLPYCLYGFTEVTSGSLRGLGMSVVPMVISLIGICGVRILWINTVFMIPQFHTPRCLYISFPLSWGVTAAVQLTAFLVICRRRARTQPGTPPA